MAFASSQDTDEIIATLDDWFDDPDGVDDVASEIRLFIQNYDDGDPDVLQRWLGIGTELVAAQVVSRVPGHKAWASVFDAFALTRPDLLQVAFDDIEVQVIDAGGDPILRPTGAVDAPPGVLAWILGARRTVGPNTLDGWTVRELSRLLAYMWLSAGSPDSDVAWTQRVIPAVRLVSYARRVDPQDVVSDEATLKDLLRRTITEADNAGTPQTMQFAQSILRSLEAEDPLAFKALTRRFGQGAIKGGINAAATAGRRVTWAWDNLPMLAVAAIVVAAVATSSGGSR